MTHGTIHICDFATPPGDKECLEMIWSQARACRHCAVECYRRGWNRQQVDADNRKLVAAKVGK
jgi:hypothetical protein